MKEDLKVLGIFAAVVFIFASFVALVAVGANIITADGRIVGCTIDTVFADNKLNLRGIRNWRPDIVISRFATLDEAIAATDKLHCPLMISETKSVKGNEHIGERMP